MLIGRDIFDLVEKIIFVLHLLEIILLEIIENELYFLSFRYSVSTNLLLSDCPSCFVGKTNSQCDRFFLSGYWLK